MKKFLTILLLSTFFIPVHSTKSDSLSQLSLFIGSNKAIVNNEDTVIDENPLIVPVIKNSSTFVPVRFIAQNLNMTVDYDENTQSVTLKNENTIVRFVINSNKINVNDKEIQIDPNNSNTVTYENHGRTFLPVRALSEAIGKQVFYDRGLILIGDDVLSVNPEKDKTKLNDIISRLNALTKVSTKENLLKLIENNNNYYSADELAKSGGGSGGRANIAADMALTESQPNMALAESAIDNKTNDDYSKTNVQVQGVDEADIVKTDGEYIYQVKDSSIIITDINPVEQLSVVSVIKDDTISFNPIEMFLDNDKLIVISNVSKYSPYVYDSAKGTEEKRLIQPIRPANQYVRCAVYNISDRSKPYLERELEIEGAYISSRKIENIVYMVTNMYIYNGIRYAEDALAPMIKDTAINESYNEISLSNVYCFPKFYENNFITISSIDIEKPDKEADSNTILGAGHNVYVSKENMYIAATTYSNEVNTDIYKFSLDNGKITFLFKQSVPGTIINQFSMDEYNGNFRIATTERNNTLSNSLYILDSAMQRRGSITNIAPGESIYSTRFMGNRGYMVTFKLVDPLFVFDLSDIDNPKILGKLKIPGYSNYLHPVDENHIIGFGKDTEEYKGNAYYQGMKMALFDISDVENPKEKFVEIIGDRGTDSALLYNHKALLYDAEKHLLAFPVTVNEIDEKKSATDYGYFAFNGAYVYNFDIENGFTLKGKITHLTKEDYLKSGYYFDGNKSIERILYANGNLFTTSRTGIFAHNLDIEYLNSIEFTK